MDGGGGWEKVPRQTGRMRVSNANFMNNKWDNKSSTTFLKKKVVLDKKTDALVKAVLALRTKSEAKKFLRDLLTEDEILEFGNRWQAAKMLSDKISYTAIRGKTGLSPRTIARISDWLQNGRGGYKLMLKRLAPHYHAPFSSAKGLRW